jgi:FkbM family methyltransferase
LKTNQPTYRNYYWRHKLIGFFRNIDLPGFRKVSLFLPKILLPKASRVEPHFILTQDKLKVWIDPAKDTGVERSLYETGTYEKGTLAFIKQHLKPGDTFIDVGANIGLMSLFASKVVGDGGSAWSFEGHPDTFKILERNAEENEIQNCHLFLCGIGEVESEMDLYLDPTDNRGASSAVRKNETTLPVKMKILPLDSIVEQHSLSPTMIKIDVEGMELEVIKGARQTIEKHRPFLIVEFGQNTQVLKEKNSELYTLLTQFKGYRFYRLKSSKERTSGWIEINSFDELPSDDNVFALPNN